MNAPACRRCGHDRTAHDHYRGGSECSVCDRCPRYRREIAVLAFCRKWREYRATREAGNIAWMYQTYPWFAGYAVFRPGRDWQAVHLASGTVLAPARTPQALHDLILADVQSRPVTVPGRDEHGDWTRLDTPPHRPADRLPRGAGGCERGSVAPAQEP